MARLLILPLVALAFFLGAYFFFYQGGGYDPPPSPGVPVEELTAPASTLGAFSDEPLVQRGAMVVDGLHSNGFSKAELSAFLSRVGDRGYQVEVLGEAGRFGGFAGVDPDSRLSVLEEKLRGADSLVVILPEDEYTSEEADLVERFVTRKGGKLLLVADPTRRNEINSLAERFGIAFQPDYLFNTVEYDLNFQNIYLRDFQPDEITRGLGQVALYTAGSIKAATPGLAVADGNTRSSMAERSEPFYPLVKAGEGRVLALHDFTFMIPPRNSILDNDRLVSNMAGYLTVSQREFDLADFPHFFKGDVDILLGRSQLFELATGLKNTLRSVRIASDIRSVEDITRDTVFLGLHDDAAQVAQYLELAGVQLDGSLRTPFTPDLARDETGVILLRPGRERHVLVVLGATEAALRDLVSRLDSGEFRDGLVGDFVGVYRTP